MSVSIQHPFAFGDWTHAFEYKFIGTNSVDISKKIHLGTEVSYGLIDLRAGFYQGYLTYGAALDFSFLKVELCLGESNLIKISFC